MTQHNSTFLPDLFRASSTTSTSLFEVAKQRIKATHEWTKNNTNGDLALLSSFGLQSAILLQAAKETGINIPVISIDMMVMNMICNGSTVKIYSEIYNLI